MKTVMLAIMRPIPTRPLPTLACACTGPRRWSRAVLALALGSAAEKQGLRVVAQGPSAMEPTAHAWMAERRAHLAPASGGGAGPAGGGRPAVSALA